MTEDAKAPMKPRGAIGDWLGWGALLLALWMAWQGHQGEISLADNAKAVFSPERIADPVPRR